MTPEEELAAAWHLLEDKPLHMVFIAGPYFGDGQEETIEANIREAEEYAIALSKLRIGFFCPHNHTRHFQIKSTAEEAFYHALDFQFLIRCDAALFMPRWKSSSGARREHTWATWRNMPIFYPLSPDNMEEIIAWDQSALLLSPLEIECRLESIIYWSTDFATLPGWNENDEARIERLREVIAGRRTILRPGILNQAHHRNG